MQDLHKSTSWAVLMIFIHFHKAFGSVEWNYLVTCLEAFCFGPDFIRWVKTLYKNIQSCGINNGLTTESGLKSPHGADEDSLATT